MDYIHAIILGIIEGLTEFLPVSSTGHLILAADLLQLEFNDFQKSFGIIIQFGAILAVVSLYWRKLLDWSLIKKLATAFVPTAIIGLLFYGIVKRFLLESPMVVLWSLLIGGIALIVFEKWYKTLPTSPQQEISYQQALGIGVFQSIAIIPGVSRSAATILGGLFLGLNRVQIVEFSFLLAVPTMLAASSLDLVKNYHIFNADNLSLLAVGFVTAFLVALFAVKYFLRFVQKHDFVPFGIYRIALAIIFFFFLV
jgi:undecaprenyl-diphosphatase